uniref:ARAD1D25982p n=1 Tax=Blastobotrys adeninivorans TaxID=409370 RepID=A0A060TAS1_BLAAD
MINTLVYDPNYSTKLKNAGKPCSEISHLSLLTTDLKTIMPGPDAGLRFHESVTQAIALSLSSGKPLLVAVSSTPVGQDAGSLISLLWDPSVVPVVSEQMVPLAVIEGTQDYTNFTQFVPVDVVPSIYIIRQSKVVDMIKESEQVNKEALLARLQDALSNTQSSPAPPTPEVPQSSPHSAPFSAESVAEAGSESHPEQSNTSPSRDQPSKPKNTNVTSVSSQQQRYREQIQRQRQAEAEERKRILKLVEKDRKERQTADRQRRLSNDTNATRSKPRAFSNSAECALSIRLFDGTALKHRFSALDSMDVVRQWVDSNRTDGDGPYSFHQPITKHTFSTGDEVKTLRDLELTPSAALVLKPASNYASAYAGSPSSWLQKGTQVVGNALYNFLGLGYDPHSPPSSSSASEASSRAGSPEPGNVHTFRPHDDRTTYNGNQLSLQDNDAP